MPTFTEGGIWARDHTFADQTRTAMVGYLSCDYSYKSMLSHTLTSNAFDYPGPELLAAVLNPQCGATIWVKNTGTFGTSVNNGVGTCITAKLVDQEGGGSVGMQFFRPALTTVTACSVLITLVQT